jgi:hypothetical protein
MCDDGAAIKFSYLHLNKKINHCQQIFIKSEKQKWFCIKFVPLIFIRILNIKKKDTDMNFKHHWSPSEIYIHVMFLYTVLVFHMIISSCGYLKFLHYLTLNARLLMKSFENDLNGHDFRILCFKVYMYSRFLFVNENKWNISVKLAF